MMARIRSIKPEFWSSAKVGNVSRDARLLFIGLWNEADDQGRLLGQPKRLAGILFPFDDDVDSKQVQSWLDQLEKAELLQRYTVKGASYIAITGFIEHQKIDKRQDSKLPPPPIPTNESAEPANESAEPAIQSADNADLLGLEQGTGNREREHGTGNRELGTGNFLCADAHNEINQKVSPPKEKFVPPTIEEIQAEIDLKGYQVDAVAFEAYYASQGWKKSNGLRMTDWKKALVRWRDDEGGKSNRTAPITFAQQREINSRKAKDEWVKNG